MGGGSHRLLCLGPHGFHRIAYRQWGDAARDEQLVCVHGLTRDSRDFNRFAAALQQDYRVTCPDVAGRGDSDWLPVKADYGYPCYVADMAALLGRLDAFAVDWVGTSMGGLIGMMLAGRPNSPIRKLVLNDIGPRVPAGLLRRITEYLGEEPGFGSLDEAAAHLRQIYPGFGPLSDEQWLEIAANSTHRQADGSYTLAYDPGVAENWRAIPSESVADMDIWNVWDAIRCPVLVLHGAESDALPAEVAEEMRRRGPRAEVIEVADTGHCPQLLDPAQIEQVRQWLLRDR